jgi:hypothetical protein
VVRTLPRKPWDEWEENRKTFSVSPEELLFVEELSRFKYRKNEVSVKQNLYDFAPAETFSRKKRYKIEDKLVNLLRISYICNEFLA